MTSDIMIDQILKKRTSEWPDIGSLVSRSVLADLTSLPSRISAAHSFQPQFTNAVGQTVISKACVPLMIDKHVAAFQIAVWHALLVKVL